ncbi:hypothetical protein [Sphingomonas colocasiae]|uniref:Holin n=1 Tax=Sphingomonas colocasiae TaxID=1848973 RepID=A0ABS7PXU7_9SPHN|nr:hypothetical protein [Sphingomonas colocasiae]MBY8826131.1 hypothetical protein [Sphingomonas colocasiae]
MRDFLAGKKTYLTVLAALLAVVISWLNGDLTDGQAIGAGFAAITAVFLRSGSKADAAAAALGQKPK